MAITQNCAKLLFYAKTLGVSFEETITLGRMNLYATKTDISELENRYKTSAKTVEEVSFRDKYAEPLFEILGAKINQSLDFSDYEGASNLHDMNKPVPEAMHGKYSVVFDGGTIEHVFNFPVCITNCMRMLKPGGHFISIAPCNNLMGHGFYQFSPELYYRVFSPENGFEVVKMFIAAQGANDKMGDWYEVLDPEKVRTRVVLVNNSPAYLFVIAKKLKEKEIFTSAPQQSDYSFTWAYKKILENKEAVPQKGGALLRIKRIVPKPVKTFARNVYNLFFKESVATTDLGTIDPTHFRKFEG